MDGGRKETHLFGPGVGKKLQHRGESATVLQESFLWLVMFRGL